MKESIFNVKKIDKSNRKIILFNTLSRTIISTDVDYKNIKDDEHKKYYELGFFVDEKHDEFSDFVFDYKRNAENEYYLTITYLTTNKCNFNCIYCYEGEKFRQSTDYKLSIEDFESIYIDLLKESNAKFIDFNFYGGEPLLEFNHILEVAQLLRKIKNKNGVEYTINIVSNGFLLDDKKIKDLKESGIKSFQITIDGSEVYHNKYRKLIDGTGTYNKILENIHLLIKNNFEIILNMNFCSENYKSIAEFLIHIPTEFKNKVYVKFNEIKDTVNNDYLFNVSNELTNIYAFLYNTLKMLKFPDYDINFLEYGPCPSKRKNSVIINRNGHLSKCIYGIGNKQLEIGNYLEDKNIIKSVFRKHVENIKFLDKCKNCPYLPLCKGGCRRKRFERGIINEVLCEKANYEKIVDAIINYYSEENSYEI